LKSNRLSIISFLFIFTLCLAQPIAQAQDLYPAKVKDISDRAYGPEVAKLLDSAKHSIAISMYTLSVAAKEPNPLSLLLKDLLQARLRGVAVTLYLNTRFNYDADVRKNIEENPSLKKLQDAGCVIQLISRNRRLHDKLIIVDSRYVVEGSTNWSLSALMNNFESATLIDSPELAGVKLQRLATLPTVLDDAKAKIPPKPIYLEGLPAQIHLSEVLITGKQYFAAMLKCGDERLMDTYLLLKAHAESSGEQEFFVDLESFGLSLGLPLEWDYTALRRQSIRALKELQKRYGLVKVSFFYGRDARVIMTDTPGAVFPIDSDIAKPDLKLKHSVRVKFLRLITAYLASKGEDAAKITDVELAGRFGCSKWTIADARKDIK